MLITIGHTYGSGGLEIGRRLAARLEIPCGDAEADEGAVRSLAGRGSCVVVGLCADHVLSGQPGLNRIFIHCGMEQRVERLMRERGLSPAEAARVMASKWNLGLPGGLLAVVPPGPPASTSDALGQCAGAAARLAAAYAALR